MRTIVPLFLLLLAAQGVVAQSNYNHTNFRYGQTTYADISATGTEIPMTDKQAGTSTTPQEIGFSFLYNGVSFTQFTIHADGILRLGTDVPGAATLVSVSPANSHAVVFGTTDSRFQNILMPFFTNLVQGAAEPQFHVQTTGTAPNRVCTVQWKNLRDADNASGGTQHQFSNLEFQVKLYETTNDIEFVYGTFTPSATTAFARFASCGIKASATSFFGLYRVSSLLPWEKSALLSTATHARINAQWRFTRLQTPPAGFSTRFFGRVATDVSVAKLFYDSIIVAGTQSPGQIEALIKNDGTSAVSNVTVTLTVSGANTHNAQVTLPTLGANDSAFVSFPAFALPNTGVQDLQITASVTGDERSVNNSFTARQVVSRSHMQIYDYSNTGVGVGFTGSANYSAVKVRGHGVRKISQIRLPFNSYRNIVRLLIYEDGGVGGAPSSSALITSSNFFTTNENDIILSFQPALTVDGDYYVVVHQTTTVNMGWRVTINNPSRPGRLYNSTTGTSWTAEGATTPWQYLVEVYEESAGPDVGIDRLVAPGCNYSTSADVQVSLRNFSAAAIDFSATPATITGFVRTPAGNDVPFTFNKNSGTLAAGAAETVTVLQNYNYAARGFHIFNARTNLAGDTEPGNDSLRFSLNNSIAITKIPNTPVCPLSEVRLVRPTFLGSMQWNVNGVLSSVDTLVLRPVANTVVYLSGQDYRGCTLLDSAIVEVTGDGLPPRPVLQFGSHVLNHRNGFRDTVRVNSLPGHTVQWLGGFGTANTDTSYLLNQVAGMNGAKVAAAYTRTADGCSNLSDTITYSYGTGVLLDNTGALAVSDSSFYDSGGPVGNTGNSFTRTFTPAIPGTRMRLVLYRLDLAPFARLELYDGPTTSSPRIQFLDNTLNGNTTREFIASNESGALTVRFVPGSFASQGWWGGLTTHVPEVYRTVSNGFWINAATWERKAPNGNFQPATRPPLKGDDTVYVRHNVLVNTSIASDQVVVEESGHLRIESPTSNFISVAAYKTTPQPEFLVRGTLTTNAFAQLFGSNGFIEVKGTFANAGQIDLDSVYFTGTQPQTVGVAGSTGKMRYIRISNPAGLTVAGDQELIGITFDQGLINTSSAAMIQFTQKGDDFVVGAGTASHINGPARVGFFGDGQRFYPIGRGGVYRPVRHFCLAANSSDQFESITAEIVPGPPPSRSFPSGINAVSQVRHYRFLRTGNNGTSYRVVLPYGTDDGVTDPVNLTIARGEGAGAWEDITGTASGPAPGTIQSAAFSGFGDFVLANKTGGGNGLLTSVRSFNNQPFPGVQVYPNPVPEVLNLQLQQPQQYRQLAVRLLDLQGRELKRWNFFQPAGLLQLGVEGLPAGTYLLELRSGQQQHVEMLRKQ